MVMEPVGETVLLPASMPPVPPPAGDPATLHEYARAYRRMAEGAATLRADIIDSGRRILWGMGFDDARDLVHRRIAALVDEIDLHHRGYGLAADSCHEYARRLEELRAAAADLDRRAGAFNQALTALISRLGAPEAGPGLAAEIEELWARRRELTAAVAAGEAAEAEAAEAAARGFLAAKISNGADLERLRRAADPGLGAERRATLARQAFGVVRQPGMTEVQVEAQLRHTTATSGLRGVLDGVVADVGAGQRAG